MKILRIATITTIALALCGCTAARIHTETPTQDGPKITTGWSMMAAPWGKAFVDQEIVLDETPEGAGFSLGSVAELEGGDALSDFFKGFFDYLIEKAAVGAVAPQPPSR